VNWDLFWRRVVFNAFFMLNDLFSRSLWEHLWQTRDLKWHLFFTILALGVCVQSMYSVVDCLGLSPWNLIGLHIQSVQTSALRRAPGREGRPIAARYATCWPSNFKMAFRPKCCFCKLPQGLHGAQVQSVYERPVIKMDCNYLPNEEDISNALLHQSVTSSAG